MFLALVALSKLTACETGLRTRREVRRTRRTLWMVSHMKGEEICDCMWSHCKPRIKRQHNSAVQVVKKSRKGLESPPGKDILTPGTTSSPHLAHLIPVTVAGSRRISCAWQPGEI